MTGHAAGIPRLSVVVCSFNRAPLLETCIPALLSELSDVEGELIVVKDGSTDNTDQVLAEAPAAVIRGGWADNRGLNAARNEGIRLARAPVILFFDDDQLPPAGYFDRLLDTLTDEFDGVGGPLLDSGGGLRTCQRCSLGDSIIDDHRREADALIGGNMAIRADAFDRVGLFDERLSGRGDETEWFHRADDLTFLYDPDLWVWHRRDSFGLAELCRYAFRQGKALPVYERLADRTKAKRGRSAARYLGHALRRRCSHGLELLCRELGAISVRSG